MNTASRILGQFLNLFTPGSESIFSVFSIAGFLFLLASFSVVGQAIHSILKLERRPFVPTLFGFGLSTTVLSLFTLISGHFSSKDYWLLLLGLDLFAVVYLILFRKKGRLQFSRDELLIALVPAFYALLLAFTLSQSELPRQYDGSTHTHFMLLMEKSGAYPDTFPFGDPSYPLHIFYGPTSHLFAELFRPLGLTLGQSWNIATLAAFWLCGLSYFALLMNLGKKPKDYWLIAILVFSPALYWTAWEAGLPELLSMALSCTGLLLVFHFERCFLGGLLLGTSFLAYPHTPIALVGSIPVGVFLLKRPFFTSSAKAAIGVLVSIVPWYFLIYRGHTQGEMYGSWNFEQPIMLPWTHFPYFFGPVVLAGALWLAPRKPPLDLWQKTLLASFFVVFLAMEHWIFLPIIDSVHFSIKTGTWNEYYRTPYFFSTPSRTPDVSAVAQLNIQPFVAALLAIPLINILKNRSSHLFSKGVLALVFMLNLFGIARINYSKPIISQADLLCLKWFRQFAYKHQSAQQAPLLKTLPWSTGKDMWAGTISESLTTQWRQEPGHAILKVTPLTTNHTHVLISSESNTQSTSQHTGKILYKSETTDGSCSILEEALNQP